MLVFWLLAAAVVALAAGLIFLRATRAARQAQVGEDPSLPVYRRQIAELDELSSRGLLGESEYRAAYAEAGRRLLAAAKSGDAGEGARKGSREMMAAALVIAVIGAGIVYAILGSPGLPDRPYASRLAEWREEDPRNMPPARLAAVLRSVMKERGDDPQGLEFLAQAELSAGDPVAARQALQRALRLQPGRSDLESMIGETMVMEARGTVTPEAEALFRRVLARDPNETAARFHLGRAEIAGGKSEAGVARLRALESELPPDDPRREQVASEIALASGRSAPPSAEAVAQAAAQVPQGQQADFIRSMVSTLAARLEQNPDDPEGWARLVRSYGVLGDRPAQAQALDRARKVLAGRPQDLARVESMVQPSP